MSFHVLFMEGYCLVDVMSKVCGIQIRLLPQEGGPVQIEGVTES